MIVAIKIVERENAAGAAMVIHRRISAHAHKIVPHRKEGVCSWGSTGHWPADFVSTIGTAQSTLFFLLVCLWRVIRITRRDRRDRRRGSSATCQGYANVAPIRAGGVAG